MTDIDEDAWTRADLAGEIIKATPEGDALTIRVLADQVRDAAAADRVDDPGTVLHDLSQTILAIRDAAISLLALHCADIDDYRDDLDELRRALTLGAGIDGWI